MCLAYESGWCSQSKRVHFKSLKDAIDRIKIEGLTFEEIYNSQESELIDVS